MSDGTGGSRCDARVVGELARVAMGQALGAGERKVDGEEGRLIRPERSLPVQTVLPSNFWHGFMYIFVTGTGFLGGLGHGT